MPEISRELITESEMWAPLLVKLCVAFGENPERGLRMKHATLAELAGTDITIIKRTVKTPLFRKLFVERMSEIADHEKPAIDMLYRELAEVALLGAFKLRAILESDNASDTLKAKVAIDVIDRAVQPARAVSPVQPLIGEVNIFNSLSPERKTRVIEMAHDVLTGVAPDVVDAPTAGKDPSSE